MTPRDELTTPPVTATVAGGVIAVCAFVAAGAAAVPGRLDQPFGTQVRYGWNYSPIIWPLLVALLAAGVLLAVRPKLGRAVAIVAAILAAQVAGFGVVAVRDWFNANGATGIAQHNLATVVTLAAAVAIASTVAGCVSLAVLWREPADGWHGLRPARPAYVLAGIVLAALLPLALGQTLGDTDITTLGQLALTYSLPWGVGLAAAGWLGRRAGIAALTTVAVSMILTVCVTGILVVAA